MMRNPIKRFAHWLNYIFYEECDDPRFGKLKTRKQLHNAHLIQASMSLIIIGSFAFIPLFVYLLTLPYFSVTYLVFCAVSGTILYGGRYYEKHIRMREADYSKQSRNGRERTEETPGFWA